MADGGVTATKEKLRALEYMSDPKKTSIEPNERLLEMAKAVLGMMWRSGRGEEEWKNEDKFANLCIELEIAVRACGAANSPSMPHNAVWTTCGCPIHVGPLPKERESGYIFFHDPDGTVRSGFPLEDSAPVSATAIPTLTDQQRRLGLRSTHHMGPDYGNFDYD